MARDNTKARLQLQLALVALDGTRPSGTLEWVSAAAPVVTQAAIGAGHWAADRRQRALAAWACAAGSALVAWGLGTEAPTRAEMVKSTQQHRDLLRKLGKRLPPEAPATAGTQAHPRQQSWFGLAALGITGIGMVTGVRSGLRHPQRPPRQENTGTTAQARSLLPHPARAAAARQGVYPPRSAYPGHTPAVSRRHDPNSTSSVWVLPAFNRNAVPAQRHRLVQATSR